MHLHCLSSTLKPELPAIFQHTNLMHCCRIELSTPTPLVIRQARQLTNGDWTPTAVQKWKTPLLWNQVITNPPRGYLQQKCPNIEWIHKHQYNSIMHGCCIIRRTIYIYICMSRTDGTQQYETSCTAVAADAAKSGRSHKVVTHSSTACYALPPWVQAITNPLRVTYLQQWWPDMTGCVYNNTRAWYTAERRFRRIR